MKTKDVRPTHVELKRVTDSALHIFQETSLNGRIEVMVETSAVILPETAYHEASKSEKTPAY